MKNSVSGIRVTLKAELEQCGRREEPLEAEAGSLVQLWRELVWPPGLLGFRSLDL